VVWSGGDEAMVSTNTPSVMVSKVSYLGSSIDIEYNMQNRTMREIWVCINNNRDTYPNFESTILKEEGIVIIKVKSFVVPEHIFLEEPIFAKYRRLVPGESRVFHLKLGLPLYGCSPLESKKPPSLNFNQLKLIALQIGYFDRDLLGEKQCCLKATDPSELLVNCFWAEKNNEKTVSIDIKNW
jgi:hypothetical protein